MKKWLGGFFIIALAAVLGFSFLFVEKELQLQPQQKQKQSVYDFFRNQPTSHSHKENDGIANVLDFPEKAHLISVQGLDDLYTMGNISKQESSVMLVWAQMRSLLSRSDAFPETAQGVKEASIAWKDLLAAIQREKTVVLDNSSIETSVRKNMSCPFLVNMLNKSLSENGMILEFPCGLVMDSSITVIGVPGGPSGSFQIELIGSQLAGETEPSVVLYYNVSFPGEDLTKYPVIVQNARTTENGWGEDERCPGHHPSNDFKGTI